MQLTLVDKLKDLDNPSVNTSNEGHTVVNPPDVDDYDEVFPNARRDSDDSVNPIAQLVTELVQALH